MDRPLAEQPADPHPALPAGLTARTPLAGDVPALVALVDLRRALAPEHGPVDPDLVQGEVVGIGSWTRRQVVVESADGSLVAWASVHDRAAGRSDLRVVVDPAFPEADALAAALFGWTSDVAAPHRRRAGRVRDQARAAPRHRRRTAARLGRGRRPPLRAHLAEHVPPGGRGRDRRGRAARRRRTPRADPRPRRRHDDALRRRPADRAPDAGGVVRGPLQLLPRELPGVRAAAARGPRPPLGPLVAGLRRGRRRPGRRAAARWRAGQHPAGARRVGHAGVATSTTSASTAAPAAAASPRRC